MPPPARPPEEPVPEDPDPHLDARIVRYLDRRSREGLRVGSVEMLAGDASTRRYYRVWWSEGADEKSSVLALLPQPFEPDEEPFLNVARLFDRLSVRVPALRDVAGAEGILLLEDCGDELLQTLAEHASRESLGALYGKALAILARIQSRGAELQSSGSGFLPYGIAFDEEKLSWELEYFRRHFLEGFRGASLTSGEKESLQESFSRLAGEIARLPRVLCHRDYHSRNLMVVDDEIVVLDFQDARMGPVSYDLVSLLRDSYVSLDSAFEQEMVARFSRLATHVSPQRLQDELDLVALQRNLKALGTFGYQCAVRQKGIYEQYVPRTLELVRANLSRNPRWDDLRAVLAARVPELM